MSVESVVSVPVWSRYICVRRLRWACSLLMVLGLFVSVLLFGLACAAWLLLGLVEISLYDKVYRLLFTFISNSAQDEVDKP